MANMDLNSMMQALDTALVSTSPTRRAGGAPERGGDPFGAGAIGTAAAARAPPSSAGGGGGLSSLAGIPPVPVAAESSARVAALTGANRRRIDESLSALGRCSRCAVRAVVTPSSW